MKKILLGILLCGVACLGFHTYKSSLAAAKTDEVQRAEPTAGAGNTSGGTIRTEAGIVLDPDTYVLSQPICNTKPDDEMTVTILLVENFDSTQYALEDDLIPLVQTDVHGMVVAEPTKTPAE